MLGQDTGPITFDVDLIRKDLRTMIDEAASQGKTLPVATQALKCFDEAAQDGMNASDAVTLPVRWMRKGKKK